MCGDVDSNNSSIYAKDDVNIIFDKMMISADSMHYDKNKSTMSFEGNIKLNQESKYFVFGENLLIDTKTGQKIFKPLFLHEKENYLWFSAANAKAEKTKYKLEDAIVSSCNPVDPEWKIAYSTGDYDTDEKWANLYNIVFYAGDFPFLYLPYIGFSTDDTRRSGFLTPTIGLSQKEGLIYEQSYYIVPSDNVDIELRVDTRSDRGQGLFTDIRFVDSHTSKGTVSFGYFKELNDGQDTFGWTNEEHFGTNIDYDRTHLFDFLFDKSVTDKFFTDINLYNDIEYVNLQTSSNEAADTSTVLTSRINYMVGGDDHYLGVYGKYFLDTTVDTTATTLQELPKVQYHQYVDSFLTDNITYSVDVKTTSRSRPSLTTAFENVITAPISYATSIFGNYINISLTEDITMSNIDFQNTEGNTSFEAGSYVSLSQTFQIDTDIMKKYENNTHALRFGASYVFPGEGEKKGFYENKEGQFDEESCTTGSLCEFVQGSIDPVERNIDIELTQYIFDDKGKEWFYHKLTQPISVENNTTYGVLENELRIKLTDHISFYHDLFYDVPLDHIDKVSSSLGYNGGGVSSIVTHLFQNQPLLSKESDYYTFKLDYDAGNNYTYVLEYAYDNLLEETRNILAGVKMAKRCWSYEIQFSQRTIPTSTASLTEQFISFKIDLLPIAGIGYEQQLSSESQ